ncbi:hypothetical protein [Brumimicrobium aurantiacum]|uniref:Uncharacterized protein n=1 Tax=Brumimicrobium aurantiacum TaxID=1737063 RepID=A0A3E1EYG1_9FLAO|nr:hypothetical protein [Brumimicrobium aurantiacum]RFC54601.1 hypothetical protein DXU93_06325 [Brumimicrobium aurantiacum]
MKFNTLITILFLFTSINLGAQEKVIHVFVALCDNDSQGIVPVPKSIGDGSKPETNLYWGAMYGMRSFFDKRAQDWKLVQEIPSKNPMILDRVLFKHKTKDVYLLADAYRGSDIKSCTESFLLSVNGQLPETITVSNKKIQVGGKSDLLVYIGHNGLMDFNVQPKFTKTTTQKDVIILGCYSKSYFKTHVRNANANPLLWTTHLMAPEAYILDGALEGYVNNETGIQIDERAAQSYNQYQKCGIKGARNLFTTGF